MDEVAGFGAFRANGRGGCSHRDSGWPGGAKGRCCSEDNRGRTSSASHFNAVDSRLPIFCDNKDVGQMGMAHMRKLMITQ